MWEREREREKKKKMFGGKPRRIERLKAQRRARCCAKIFLYSIIFFTLFLVLLFVILQTPRAQRSLLESCDMVQHGRSKERGMPLEYERITGIFPFSFTMHDLEFIDPAGRVVRVERSQVNFDVLSPLISGRIRIHSIRLHNARMSPAIKHEERLTHAKDRMEVPPWPDLILGVDVRSMVWDSLYMQSYGLTLKVNGTFEIEPSGGNIKGEMHLTTEEAYIYMKLFGNSSDALLSANGKATNLWYHIANNRLCTVSETEYRVNGSWKAWELLSFPTATLDGKTTDGEFPKQDLALGFASKGLICTHDGVSSLSPSVSKKSQSPIVPSSLKRRTNEELFSDYAAFIPSEVSVNSFLDRNRNLDVEYLFVNGSGNYLLSGSAFILLEGEEEETFRVDLATAETAAIFRKIVSFSLHATNLGGNWSIKTAPLLPSSIVTQEEDTLLTPIIMKGDFSYPDENGDAHIGSVEFTVDGVEESSSFQGEFDVHMPDSMRTTRGADRDIIVIEGSINGQNDALSLSLTMEADENLEQRFHSRIEFNQVSADTKAESFSLESGWLEFELGRFPFDTHGTISGELLNLNTSTIDAEYARFDATRDEFITRALHTKHMIRRDNHRSINKKRPWNILFESAGGDRLSSSRVSSELDISQGIFLKIFPDSEIIYKSIHGWLNETGKFNYNWQSGDHSGDFSLHTYDTKNKTYGNVSLSFEGDWNSTIYGTEFQHQLHSISSLELLPKRFTGHINGSILFIHDKKGHIQFEEGDLTLRNTNVYKDIVQNDLFLRNLTVHIEGGDRKWKLCYFTVEVPFPDNGYISGNGTFLAPRENQYLSVSLQFEIDNVSYLYNGNVTLDGEINLHNYYH